MNKNIFRKACSKKYPLQNYTFCLSLSPTKSSRSVIAFIAGRAFILPQQVGITDFDREFPTASLSRAKRCRVEQVSVWRPARFYFWIHKDGDNENHWPFLQVTAEPPSSAHHATEDWLDFLSVLVDKELLIRAEEYERDHKEPGKAFITSSALCRPYIYIYNPLMGERCLEILKRWNRRQWRKQKTMPLVQRSHECSERGRLRQSKWCTCIFAILSAVAYPDARCSCT